MIDMMQLGIFFIHFNEMQPDKNPVKTHQCVSAKAESYWHCWSANTIQLCEQWWPCEMSGWQAIHAPPVERRKNLNKHKQNSMLLLLRKKKRFFGAKT